MSKLNSNFGIFFAAGIAIPAITVYATIAIAQNTVERLDFILVGILMEIVLLNLLSVIINHVARSTKGTVRTFLRGAFNADGPMPTNASLSTILLSLLATATILLYIVLVIWGFPRALKAYLQIDGAHTAALVSNCKLETDSTTVSNPLDAGTMRLTLNYAGHAASFETDTRIAELYKACTDGDPIGVYYSPKFPALFITDDNQL